MQKVQKRETVPPVGRWGEREQGIIEVATQLYLQGGYENVTMAAVASAAGLSEGTLYNYFRDKQDLQLRVSLTAFEGHTQAAEKGGRRGEEPARGAGAPDRHRASAS